MCTPNGENHTLISSLVCLWQSFRVRKMPNGENGSPPKINKSTVRLLDSSTVLKVQTHLGD